MKNIILIFILLFTVSCASKKVYKPIQTNKVFTPYYDNWKVNDFRADEYLKGVEREIPIFFTHFEPSLVGKCQLHKDVNERKIYMDKRFWNMYPEKREKYVSDLLTICYSTRRGQEVYYDIPYMGF
jgi:hypothetical protein